ncbi:MAG: tRNA (adenosine(37)-N6)-dimethylallyltransferase MiaA [Gilvibacter sp.]
MTAPLPLLICVVGPTAIGKTRLAIALAKAFDTQIISADSRQFFKEMNIGTAVPSAQELAAAKHHFIQHISITQSYNVGQFEKDALALIDELHTQYNPVIMVGGSGLYVDAVVKGLDIFPEVAPEVREQLNLELQNNGIEALQAQLKQVDPAYFAQADVKNPHRVIRALEVYRQTKKPFSSFLSQQKNQRPFKTLWIGLNAPRELVYDRINKRVDIMIASGLVEEAKALYSQRDLNALQTVGYRELFTYFDGACSLDEAIAEIKKNTRRFAKRQETWFKKNPDINWFDYDSKPEDVIAFIKQL